MRSHTLHSKWHPLDKLFFIVTAPLWISCYWLWTTYCQEKRGHEWENDWGGDVETPGETIREYDNCKHCPAQRSRDPREIEE